MESLESMHEVFIKEEDIKQEVSEDENILSCSSVDDEIIEMNVDVKEEPGFEPNEFVDIKHEHLQIHEVEPNYEFIKQEDILGKPRKITLNPKLKRRISEDSLEPTQDKKPRFNSTPSALLDHCYQYTGATTQQGLGQTCNSRYVVVLVGDAFKIEN